MRKKRVWRYYCDYCKKSNCSSVSISEHEKHCTMNPERQCRMCKAAESIQPSLVGLMRCLPHLDVLDTRSNDEIWNGELSPLDKALQDALPALRVKSKNCPACMLAALRQAKIPLPLDGFDYSGECEAFWAQVREDGEKDAAYAAMYN